MYFSGLYVYNNDDRCGKKKFLNNALTVKRLFIKRRKEHLEAVRNLRKMNSYERQYKMINVLAEKMFDVIESKKALLENFTESDLQSVTFAVDAKNDVQDGKHIYPIYISYF